MSPLNVDYFYSLAGGQFPNVSRSLQLHENYDLNSATALLA